MLGPTAHDAPQHTLRSTTHTHPDVPIRPILSNLIHSCTHWRVSPIPAGGLEVMRASLVVLLALLIVGVGVALRDVEVYHRVEKIAPSTSRPVPDHAAAPSPCRPVSSDGGPENGGRGAERDEDTPPPRPRPPGGHPRREDLDTTDPRTGRSSLAGGLAGSRAEGNFRCPAGVDDRTISTCKGS